MWGRLRKGASSCGLKIAIIGVFSFPVFALVSPVSVSVLSSGYLNPVQWLSQPCSVATSTLFSGYLNHVRWLFERIRCLCFCHICVAMSRLFDICKPFNLLKISKSMAEKITITCICLNYLLTLR